MKKILFSLTIVGLSLAQMPYNLQKLQNIMKDSLKTYKQASDMNIDNLDAQSAKIFGDLVNSEGDLQLDFVGMDSLYNSTYDKTQNFLFKKEKTAQTVQKGLLDTVDITGDINKGKDEFLEGWEN